MTAFPKTCHEVQMSGGIEGYHTIDPEQDDLDPISVFCNMSITPVTAVLHHNLEEWIYVSGYEETGSYNGQVCATTPKGGSRFWKTSFPKIRCDFIKFL